MQYNNSSVYDARINSEKQGLIFFHMPKTEL